MNLLRKSFRYLDAVSVWIQATARSQAWQARLGIDVPMCHATPSDATGIISELILSLCSTVFVVCLRSRLRARLCVYLTVTTRVVIVDPQVDP